jgi:hypothetical protein
MPVNTTLIFIFLTFCSFGQAVVDTVKIPFNARTGNRPDGDLFFPLVRTGDKNIDGLINNDIQVNFSQNEYQHETMDSTLLDMVEDGLVYFDFRVTYNKNKILSLQISAEGCGAYCTGWTQYFNYSLATGRPLNINAIVDTSGAFGTMVLQQKAIQFTEQRSILEEISEEELDMETYEVTREYYQECESNFNFQNFVLYADALEVICDCFLPHVIQSLAPSIELKFPYSTLTPYLKVKLAE